MRQRDRNKPVEMNIASEGNELVFFPVLLVCFKRLDCKLAMVFTHDTSTQETGASSKSAWATEHGSISK